MRAFTFALAAAALATALMPRPAAADVIRLRADDWCPFNCGAESGRPGYMVEIAREALALFGHEVQYETMNWARSLELANAGAIDGVIGTDADEAPSLILGPPMGEYREAAAFRAGEARPITEAADFKDLRVGGILGYEYSTIAVDFIEEHGSDPSRVQLIGGGDALERNLRKLAAGRLDTVLEERSVLSFTIATMGLGGQVVLSPLDEVSDLHIGFSPVLDTSALYARQLAQGVEQLRASGRYQEILASYGLDH